MTSIQEISKWFDSGVKDGYTHMVIMCDTFDWEDYPQYFTFSENVDIHKKIKKLNQNMQTVMEVYKLSEDKRKQLKEKISLNY